MTTQLYKNIIATITYFDVNDYPLTSFEIWKHLIKINSNTNKLENEEQDNYSFREILKVLKTEEFKKYVAEKNGFYFLQGRDKIIEKRRQNEVISVYKIKKLQKKVHLLRFTPFVQMICLTGKLSQKNGSNKSDLDVLIVLKSGHIWTGRFLVTFLTQILGWRRHGKKQKNRICLNYYVTEKSLKVPTQDLFSAQEYSFILPLFDNNNYFNKFQRANREWIQSYKPNYDIYAFKSDLTIADCKFSHFFRLVFERILSFNFIENILRHIQKHKILDNPKTKVIGSLIIANDKHLVFLPEPHGPKIFSEYKARFEALEIS